MNAGEKPEVCRRAMLSAKVREHAKVNVTLYLATKTNAQERGFIDT